MWFFYALAFAIISSFSVIIAKKVMQSVDQYSYLLFVSICTVPYLIILSLVFFKQPNLDRAFWLAITTGTAISVVAAILAYKAIRESEVSLVNPISAFNPMFVAIISFFILNEMLGLRDVLGIIVIVIGAYVLQASKSKKGFFEPIRALVTHKGVQLSFVAYFLWAITPSFEKTAILHANPSNPLFVASVEKTLSILIFIPIVFKKSITPIKKVFASWRLILLDGLLGGLGIGAAFMAYSLSPLGLATAVFKLSVVIVPVLGWLFFKEKDIKERLLGALIMLGGVILLLT